jgi:hypothetical protein
MERSTPSSETRFQLGEYAEWPDQPQNGTKAWGEGKEVVVRLVRLQGAPPDISHLVPDGGHHPKVHRGLNRRSTDVVPGAEEPGPNLPRKIANDWVAGSLLDDIARNWSGEQVRGQ